MNVSIALIQSSVLADIKSNLDQTLLNIRKSVKNGANIVCLSELFLSNYFCQTNDKKHFDLAETIPGPTSDVLSKISQELGMVLVASLFERDGSKYYNTAIILDGGKLVEKYRKIHIPDDLKNHYSEKFYFSEGNLPLKATQTQFGKIGVLVCWDQWYPEPARRLATDGAQIIFYPTAIGWPNQEREIGTNEFDAWVTIQRSHAIANGVFVASCNRVGVEDHIQFWGGSFICDPFGKILSQATHDEEKSLMASVNLDDIAAVRNDWPFLDCRKLT